MNNKETVASEKGTELLPCPFCDGIAQIIQWRDTENPNATWVECMNCGACQEAFHHPDAEHVKGIARMMWNTRIANIDAHAASTDRLREACELKDKAIKGLLSAMDMQEKRETEEFHIPQPSAWKIWSDAKALGVGAILKAEESDPWCDDCRCYHEAECPNLHPTAMSALEKGETK